MKNLGVFIVATLCAAGAMADNNYQAPIDIASISTVNADAAQYGQSLPVSNAVDRKLERQMNKANRQFHKALELKLQNQLNKELSI